MSVQSFPKNILDLALALPNYLREIKNYEIKRSIGKGGFGEVFLGTDKTTKKKVAIKQPLPGKIPANFSSAYIREIYIMASMNSISPYFLPLAGYTIESPYSIITEYMSKGSLSKYYQLNTSNPKFTGTQSQIMAIQILLGINSMHSRGFIHRDLKLGNILLDQDNIPRIADLGLSRAKTDDNLMTHKIGTYYTMAPEVFYNKPYTYSADVYSFGIILYVMNERRNPSQNMSKTELQNGSMYRIPSLQYSNTTSEEMRDLINSCISLDPKQRPTIQTIIGKLINGEVNFNGAKAAKIFQHFNKHKINNFIRPKLPDKIPNYQEKLQGLQQRYKSFLEDKKKRMEEQKKKSEEKEKSEATTTNITNNNQAANENTLIDNSFYEAFTKKMTELSPDNFDSFFDQIIKFYLGNDQYSKWQEFIVSSVSSIINTDYHYVHLFSNRNYEQLIPLTSPTLILYAVEYLGFLFEYSPNDVSPSSLELMNDLIEKKPSEIAFIFSYYAAQFDKINDPFPAIDTFLNHHKFFLNDSDTSQSYLTIIYYLVTKFPAFCAKKMSDVKTVLSNSIKSKVALQHGLQTLALIYTPDFDDIISFDIVTTGLTDETIRDLCISLLLRVDKIPFSEDLYTKLLELSKTNEKAARILLKLSECSAQHISHFVDNLDWLLYDLPTIKQTFTLFLSVFRNNQYRDKICLSDQFINFLNRFTSTHQSYYLSVIPSLLRRFNITKEFAKKLEVNGFFKNYFETAISLNDPEVNMKAAILLDQTARFFFCNDMLLFIPRLREMASINGQADVAISAATSLSYFPAFKITLVRCGFVQAFQYLRNSAVYGDKAKMFLKNIGGM